MADYEVPSVDPPVEQLRRAVLAADPGAMVDIQLGQIVRISAPALDVVALKGVLAPFADLVGSAAVLDARIKPTTGKAG
jgi:hypothetical protein